MRKNLEVQEKETSFSQSIKAAQRDIERLFWLVAAKAGSLPCSLNIVGYSAFSTDTYEVTEGYKDGNFGACQRSTRSYYDGDGDFLYSRRVVRFGKSPGAELNQYADRGDPSCSRPDYVNQPDINQRYVGVGFGIASSNSWGAVTDHGTYFERVSSTTIQATPTFCDDPIKDYGWYYVSKLVRTYKITRDPSLGNLMDYKTYLWEATTGSGHVIAAVSPSSGSYTWLPGETEKFITLTLEMTGTADMENLWGSYGQQIELTLQRNGRYSDCQLNHTWEVTW